MPTNMHDVFEENRFLSVLSDRFVTFDYNGKRYACFSGIILPLNIAQSVVLWAWTGYQSYSRGLNNPFVLEEIKELNPNNHEILNPMLSIPSHLTLKLQEIMRNWTPDNFEDLLCSNVFKHTDDQSDNMYIKHPF